MPIFIDDNLFDHPKTIRLNELLNSRQAIIYVIRLWAWAWKYSSSGDLSKLEPRRIITIAGWRRERDRTKNEASRFIRALEKSGFLDAGWKLHDWKFYNGNARAIIRDRREKERFSSLKNDGNAKRPAHDSEQKNAPSLPFPSDLKIRTPKRGSSEPFSASPSASRSEREQKLDAAAERLFEAWPWRETFSTGRVRSAVERHTAPEELPAIEAAMRALTPKWKEQNPRVTAASWVRNRRFTENRPKNGRAAAPAAAAAPTVDHEASWKAAFGEHFPGEPWPGLAAAMARIKAAGGMQ